MAVAAEEVVASEPLLCKGRRAGLAIGEEEGSPARYLDFERRLRAIVLREY